MERNAMPTRSAAIDDQLVALGRGPADNGRPVNLPLDQSSTRLFNSVAELEAAKAARYDHGTLYYGRYGTPSSFALEKMIAELEGGDHCVAVSSGLTAVTVALMASASAGAHLLVADTVYGPTRQFCETVLARYGVEVDFFDPMIGAGLAERFRPNTRAVMIEAPGSLTFEVPDIPALAGVARDHGAISILDGTWATPVHCRPLDLGVDVVVHSGSKYVSGHSDVMIGFITCRAAHYDAMRKMALAFGDRPGAQDVYLSLRGLRTLAIRMRETEQRALEVARWLAERGEVARLLHPAFESCLGHGFWKRDFLGASGLFSVVLQPEYADRAATFIDALELFGIGLSWGGFESLAIPAEPGPERRSRLGVGSAPIIRFSIGLESPDSLIADLRQAFEILA